MSSQTQPGIYAYVHVVELVHLQTVLEEVTGKLQILAMWGKQSDSICLNSRVGEVNALEY
jgi:hypothetical protein